MKRMTRRDFLKISGVASVGAAAVLLAGCSDKTGDTDDGKTEDTEKTPSNDGTGNTVVDENPATATDDQVSAVAKKIVMQVPTDPGSYDPFIAGAITGSETKNFIYEGMFTRYQEGVATPLMASGYERTGAGVYKITLKDGIIDHKGYPVTVDDIVWCYETALAGGRMGADFNQIDRVEKIDDHTIEMAFKTDTVGLFALDASQSVFSRKAYEESENGFTNDPVATGPYKIKEWIPGTSVSFEKYEDYWNKDNVDDPRQNVDAIEVKIISEATQVAIALETGEVDFAYSVSVNDAARFQEESGFSVHELVSDQMSCVIFNCDPICPFNDVKLRQAVCYAINEQAILASVYRGIGGVCNAWAVPGDGKVFYADYPAEWDNKEQMYPYDVEKAKQLMEEAGKADGFKARIMTKDNAADKSTAEVIQSCLKEINIEVEILSYENALYQTYRYDPTQFEMYIGGGGAAKGYIPMAWKWYLYNDAATGRNNVFIQDDKLQELLDKCLVEETHSEETVMEAWDYLEEIIPIYPNVYTSKFYVCSEGITPFLTGANYTFLPYKSVYEEPFLNKY